MKLCSSMMQKELKKTEKLSKKQPNIKSFQIVPTIHKDCVERLVMINPSLASQVRKVLNANKAERHIRGGLATKEKYLAYHVKKS